MPLERDRRAQLVVGQEGAQRVGAGRRCRPPRGSGGPARQRDRRRAEGHGLLGDADLLDRDREPLAAGGDHLLDQQLGRRGAGRQAQRARRRRTRPSRSPRPSRSAAPRAAALAGGRPRPAAPSWTSWPHPRPGTARRAARSRPRRAGGWWWRSRCPRCAAPRSPGSAAAAPRRCRRCRPATAWSGSSRRAGPGSGTAIVSASATVSTSSTEPGATWPMVPITSGWPAWPISSTVRPGLVVALDLAVHLGDQRAGGVGEQQPAAPRLGRHRLGHAVRREHHQPVLGHLVQLLDEHRTQPAQLVDHVAVVDDLVADIDRRAVLAQGLLDHVDGALDPGAEAARAGEQDLERRERGRQGRRLSAASDRAVPNTKVAARRERAAWSRPKAVPGARSGVGPRPSSRMMSGSRGHRGRGFVRLRSSYCLTGLTSPAYGVRFPALHRSLGSARGRFVREATDASCVHISCQWRADTMFCFCSEAPAPVNCPITLDFRARDLPVRPATTTYDERVIAVRCRRQRPIRV